MEQISFGLKTFRANKFWLNWTIQEKDYFWPFFTPYLSLRPSLLHYTYILRQKLWHMYVLTIIGFRANMLSFTFCQSVLKYALLFGMRRGVLSFVNISQIVVFAYIQPKIYHLYAFLITIPTIDGHCTVGQEGQLSLISTKSREK